MHDLAKIQATFDDPNLVSRAGLAPEMALAQRVGLAGLAGEHVRAGRRCGVNAPVKVVCEVRSFGCGALAPDQDGPVHKYMLSAPGCWTLYGSVLA